MTFLSCMIVCLPFAAAVSWSILIAWKSLTNWMPDMVSAVRIANSAPRSKALTAMRDISSPTVGVIHVRYTRHAWYCILYIVYCILYIVYCILYIVYCILYIVYCILYIVYCILYIVYCILYIVYCILYIVYCILYIVYCMDIEWRPVYHYTRSTVLLIGYTRWRCRINLYTA